MTRPQLTAYNWAPDEGRGLVRDMRVRWALEEVGQPYDVRYLNWGEQKEPPHRARNPFGQVPAYEEDGLTLFESGAIVLHIAERWPGLWPADRRPETFDVADVDEWLTVIAAGEAVGVTAEATEHIHPHPGVRYVELADAPLITVILAWPRPPTHPATGAFSAHLRRLIAVRRSASDHA